MSFFNKNLADFHVWLLRFPGKCVGCLLLLVAIGCGGEGEPETPASEQAVGPQLSSEIVPAMDVVGASQAQPPPPNPLAGQVAQAPVGAQDKAGSFSPDATATKEEAEEWVNQLNFMVSEYNGTFGKMPSDLDEFIRRGYFKNMPPAPTGKKYFLDPESKQVVLKDN